LCHFIIQENKYKSFQSGHVALNLLLERKNATRVWYLEDLSIVPEGIVQQREQKTYSYEEPYNRTDLSQEYVTEPETDAFGTVTVNNIGTVRVKDEDSLAVAEAF
jgi:hypothetical protein